MRYPKILALLPVLLLCGAPTFSAAQADVSFSVSLAPPELPSYDQPPLPEPGYIWTPGYWAWDGSDYYWVPGTWVLPPVADMLWTPGYWGWRDGFYGWNPGYWGPEVGYYGGIDYGYGYPGVGFAGGYWHGGAFFYNRAVANFGRANVVNVYTAPVRIHDRSRVSFNGGQGGLRYQPSAAERAVMNQHHTAATGPQVQHQQRAASMPDMHVSHNGGRPQILTTQRPADFAHPGPGLHNHQQPERPQAEHPQPAAVTHAAAPQRPDTEPSHFDERAIHNHAQPERQQPERQQPERQQPERQQPERQQPGLEPRAAAPQRPATESPHFPGPGPAMRGPAQAPRPEPQGERPPQGGGGVAERQGGPPHEQAPPPQAAHEQPRHEAPPKHEPEPKRER